MIKSQYILCDEGIREKKRVLVLHIHTHTNTPTQNSEEILMTITVLLSVIGHVIKVGIYNNLLQYP